MNGHDRQCPIQSRQVGIPRDKAAQGFAARRTFRTPQPETRGERRIGVKDAIYGWTLDNDPGVFLLPNDLCPNGSRAVLAQVFVLVTFGKHEEESFPDGHGPTALGAIEFCRIELFIHFRCGTSLRAFSWIDKTDVHTM